MQTNRLLHPKRWLLPAVVAALVCAGCASQQERAARRALVRHAVAEGVDSRQLRININSMSPMRYNTRTVSYGFYLHISGDSVESYLPYMGQVYRTPVVSSPQGLNFDAPIVDYQHYQPKSGLWRIDFTTSSEEDHYLYSIEVHDNGTALVRVRGEYRDPISFIGDVDMPAALTSKSHDQPQE